MADLTLETERLVLRPPQLGDLDWIQAEINTPGMMRHLGGAVRDPAMVREALARDIAAFACGEYRRWTVWLRDPAIRAGRCGLFVIRTQAAPAALRGQPEVGWMLAEAHQGHGLMSEAARAVLGFGFERIGHPQIYAQTSDSNGPSTRMMARLGFTRMAELDYVDPDYPPADNPTTVYRLGQGDQAKSQ